MSFYFAYGANMDQDLLHKRAKSGPPCGFTDLNLKKSEMLYCLTLSLDLRDILRRGTEQQQQQLNHQDIL